MSPPSYYLARVFSFFFYIFCSSFLDILAKPYRGTGWLSILLKKKGRTNSKEILANFLIIKWNTYTRVIKDIIIYMRFSNIKIRYFIANIIISHHMALPTLQFALMRHLILLAVCYFIVFYCFNFINKS